MARVSASLAKHFLIKFDSLAISLQAIFSWYDIIHSLIQEAAVGLRKGEKGRERERRKFALG